MSRWIVALALVSSTALAQVPERLGYQGRLLKADGQPEAGAVSLTFKVFDTPAAGSELWKETQVLALADGYYAVMLGDVTPLSPEVFGSGERYLEVSLGGEPLLPRHKLGSVPYAFSALKARDLEGGTVNAASIKVNGASVVDSSGRVAFERLGGCASADQILKWDGSSWSCAAYNAGIEIGAGAGIAVGGTPTAPSIAVKFGTAAGTAAEGNDPRLSDARPPKMTAGAGITLGGPADNPSISVAFGSGAGVAVEGNDPRLSDARTPKMVAGAGIVLGGDPATPSVGVKFGSAAGTAVEGNDPRLSDSRTPKAGSADYIQNQTGSAQDAGFSIGKNALVGGRVGIGTTDPKDKLDVRGGGLFVENDLFFMPTSSCRSFVFDNPSADLGDQLKSLLDKYRCSSVILKANTAWIWNKPISLANGQTLAVAGEGYTNGAANITVTINMTTNTKVVYYGVESRDPTRVSVSEGGTFRLQGVKVVENSNDTRPLQGCACNGGALFTVSYGRAVLELSQVYVTSSEDVVGVGTWAEGTVYFGHTFINQNPGSPRSILATKSHTGCCFSGGFGQIHASHTTLGTNVTMQSHAKLAYSY